MFIVSDENESAKRFDNLLYQLQLKRIRTEKTIRCENAIIDTVSELEKLGTVPQVKEKQELILKVAETDYLKEADFWKVEEIRKELRDLIQFIDPYNRPPVYIDIEDTLNDIDEEYVYVSTGNNFTNYRKKLEKFLTGNLENSIIWKIRHNIRLTELEKENLEKILFEELGSNKEYAETFGDTNVIKAVRNIVGLDKSVASDIFYKYINENRLNMKQIQFVKLLVDYVVKNGTIEMEKLTEQPFNTVGQVYELFGNNVDLFKEIREDIEEIKGCISKLVTYTMNQYEHPYQASDYKTVCTDRRVIIFKTGLFSNKLVDIPVKNIISIQNKVGLIFGNIEIHYNGTWIKIGNIPKKEINLYTNCINEQMENYKTISISEHISTEENYINKISRLADLYKDGKLTEYEYSIKKQELLENIKNNK